MSVSHPLSVYKKIPRRLPLSLGFSRYALNFDGDDYVEVPDSPSISLSTAATLIFWMKPEAELNMGVFVKGHSYNVQATMAVAGIWCNFYSGGTGYATRCTDPPLSVGKWYHIAITLETPGEPTIYINGEPATAYAYRNAVPGPIDDVADPLRIGYIYPNQNYFYGILDQPLFYNRVLSQKEIRYTMLNYHNPVRDGLVLWLPFEEGAGNTAYDRSGYGNHGTIVGATWARVKMWELRSEVGL